MSYKAKIILIKFLIERYKKEIEELKHNKMFDEELRARSSGRLPAWRGRSG